MSITPSGLSERFPIRRLPRQGAVVQKDLSPDKKHEKKNLEKSPPFEFDPTGLVQRCVIIQRDENGFGLTVSGDNPVFVQSVKEDGAAVRAGVQQGDRIIKVNGTLVTHSNHVEVVRLIKSGSYVALTVLGRPPGSPQIPLSTSDGDSGTFLFPGQPAPVFSPTSSTERITSPTLMGEDTIVHSQKLQILQSMLDTECQQYQLLKEKCQKNPTQQLLREKQEAEKRIHQVREQLHKASGISQDVPGSATLSETLSIVEATTEEVRELEPYLHSPSESEIMERIQTSFSQIETDVSPFAVQDGLSPRDYPPSGSASFKDSGNCERAETDDSPDWDSQLGSPPLRGGAHIIGAEDDDFGNEAEQVDIQCSCFQTLETLRSRPAHVVAFLHHVLSQFDPVPSLCYLYAEFYNQTNSKENRRVFVEFYHLFLEKGANLKVQAPEGITAELERRRLDLIPEELQRQFVQTVQDNVLAEVQAHLQDFRQKRNMGMTIGEVELSKLDLERSRDRNMCEQRERLCAEQLLLKIEEVLATLSPTEEEKSNSMLDVILTYMKHLGVKVKDPRNLDRDRRIRVAFFPKKKASIKKEKEDEKKKRFQSILDPIRRTSKQDRIAIEKAKILHQKQLNQPNRSASLPEHPEPVRLRPMGSSSDTTDGNQHLSPGAVPGHEGPTERLPDPLAGPVLGKPFGDNPLSGDLSTSTPKPGTIFDYPTGLVQVIEEDQESESVETATPPCTPRPGRRGESLGWGDGQGGSQSPSLSQTEEDQTHISDVEQDPTNWQQLVTREVLAGLKPLEIKRQEVINELFHTERAHIRMLRVLDVIFQQKMVRDGTLPPGDIKHIFCNLEAILQLHVSLNERMKKVWKKNENLVVDNIGEELLAWFSGPEEEKFKRAAATFCSNQPFALEFIKNKQKKDSRFQAVIQEAESKPQCRRLQLKDIIPTEMQRLTKYPLLLENIAKNTEQLEEKQKVRKAAECCRHILNYVNQTVKEAENKARLEDYQRRLDLSSLKQLDYPLIEEFRSLDLTKRNMIHEGPLTWRVNKDKTIDLYTLLLEDILVLSQKQDEKLVLKCHSKNLAATADTKHTFSPIIKLTSVLVREVATDNKAFFVISMSVDGAQIYELVAHTVSERKTWQYLITQASDSIKPLPHQVSTDRSVTEGLQEDDVESIPAEAQGSSDDRGISPPDKEVNSVAFSAELPPRTQEPGVHSLPHDTRSNLCEGAVRRASATRILPSRADLALKKLTSLRQLLLHLIDADEENVVASLKHLTQQDYLHAPLQEEICAPRQEHTNVLLQDSAHLSLRRDTIYASLGLDTLHPSLGEDTMYTSLGENTSELLGENLMHSSSVSLECTTCEMPNEALHGRLELDMGSLPETSVTTRTCPSSQITLETGKLEYSGKVERDDCAVEERFYDAPEVHSEERPLDEDGGRSQIRVSGSYLMLEELEEMQESCTDPNETPAQFPECTAGSPDLRPEECRADGADLRTQILQCFESLESDLKHLQAVELEFYSQRELEAASAQPVGNS
ncbi:rho guanine nucleotide exchange factor 12 isoform X2 [Callorhinchus milii]|uniref:rho guanine nucleotide exchange factor 12 isoform X2 n=1 Tax=Callorhinchus milii TaxID=7868 RepID=UPI001C3FD6AE|nr:rho guanine nucleotide exchange factor 12 isoform X2 [Callorhinchus milii]